MPSILSKSTATKAIGRSGSRGCSETVGRMTRPPTTIEAII